MAQRWPFSQAPHWGRFRMVRRQNVVRRALRAGDRLRQAGLLRQEQQLKEEIAALKEHLAKEDEPEEAPKTVLAANKNQEKGDINDYARMVSRVGYSRTSVPLKPEHEVEAPMSSPRGIWGDGRLHPDQPDLF